MKCVDKDDLNDNYLELVRYLLDFTYEDYFYFCRGKIPSTYPFHVREKKSNIPIEREKIERMITNGVCDYLLIDPKDFSATLERIRRECECEDE